MALKQVYLIPENADYVADGDDFMARVVTRSDPTTVTGLTNDTLYSALAAAFLTETHQTFTPSASGGTASDGVVFDSTQYLDRAQVLSDGTQPLTFFLDCTPASGTGLQEYIVGRDVSAGGNLGAGLTERGGEKGGMIVKDTTGTTVGSDCRGGSWTNAQRYRIIGSFQKIGSDYELRVATKTGSASWVDATATSIVAPATAPYFGLSTRLFGVADMTVYRAAVVRAAWNPNGETTSGSGVNTKELLLESDGTTLPDVTVLQTAAGANLLFDMYGTATGWETPKAGTWGAFTLTGSLSDA